MANFNRDQIKTALAENDASYSNYLDLNTGEVVRMNDTDTSPDTEQLRTMVMEGYGDRFRYIPGGNPSPDDGAVDAWIEAEGL